MKKGLLPALALCLSLTGCAGLPRPREMGDMALLRAMGVDSRGSEVEVTVSTSPRSRGLQGEREGALLLSARGPSLSAAALTLQVLSDSYVFFGYVDQLLLGEELTRQGISPVLDYFARDGELGLGAQLWIVRGGEARQAVEAGGDSGVDGRLSTLRTDGEMGIAAIARTAGEIYSDLLEQGSAYVPALTPGEEEQAVLVETGYAVLKDDRLAGFLDGEAARGLELLAGKPSADILKVELARGPVCLRVTGADTTCSFEDRDGRGPQLALVCRVTLCLAEYQEKPGVAELQQIQKEVADRERRRIGIAFNTLRAWRTDCLGLGQKAALSAPGFWEKLSGEWERHFAEQAPEVELQIDIQE